MQAGAKYYKCLFESRNPGDPVVVSGMFGIACLWLCLDEVKESWSTAERDVPRSRVLVEKHAVWTVAMPKVGQGELPELHPWAELAVRM